MSRGSGERIFPEEDMSVLPQRYGSGPPYHHIRDPRALKDSSPLPAPGTQHREQKRGKKRRGFCRKCYCCLCTTLLTIVLLLGIGALVVWLVLHPKAPQYSVQNVEINALAPVLLPPPPHLDYDFIFQVEANNPNTKIGIYYDILRINLFYQGVPIGDKTVPSFYQGHQNITVLHIQLDNPSLPLDPSISASLLSDISNGSMPIKAQVRVKARVKVGSWKSFAFWVRVDCDLVISPPGSPGGPRLLSKKCGVKR